MAAEAKEQQNEEIYMSHHAPHAEEEQRQRQPFPPPPMPCDTPSPQVGPMSETRAEPGNQSAEGFECGEGSDNNLTINLIYRYAAGLQRIIK